jgi:hypothetical protein
MHHLLDFLALFFPFFAIGTATPSNNANPCTPASTVVPPYPNINPQDQANFSGTQVIGGVSMPNTGTVKPATSGVAGIQRLAANPGVFQFRQVVINPIRGNAAQVYIGGSNPPLVTLPIPTAVPVGTVGAYNLPTQSDPTKVYDLYYIFIQINQAGDGVVWEGYN